MVKKPTPKGSQTSGQIKTKTVNRTGKSLVQKALVVKAKKNKTITDKASIQKLNEEIQKKKLAVVENLEAKKEVVDTNKSDNAKPDKEYTLTIGLKDLLDAGCHLGHKVSKTNPKAKENIYSQKDGIEIFDLIKTLENLKKACNFIYNCKRNGKQVILVGTKRQAREVVRRVAVDAGVPFVTDRWLGGTISNWDEIKKNIKKLNKLKEGLEKGEFTSNTKKELSEMRKEVIRLEKIVGGLTNLEKIFDVLFVIDAGLEKTAIKEANLKGIKTVGIVDTDTDPKKVSFPIPCNDDNVKSISIIVEEIGKAIKSA